MNANEFFAYVMVFGCGIAIGAIIASRCAFRRNRECAEQEKELGAALRSRDEWQAEAERLRSVVDGTYHPMAKTPKFPRPLGRG